jgi:flagellar biosynthesis protein FlhF
MYVRLIQNDVEEDLAKTLISKVISECPSNILNDKNFLERRLEAHIMDMIRVEDGFQDDGYSPKAIILVGPTGVGKTTTLAKLAAEFAFGKRKKVAIITVDTYRIAAVEQLKTYAEILDIPMEVAFEYSEFRQAIENFSNADIILIDTAGRSQKNNIQMQELKNFIDAAGCKMEVVLLLSAITKNKELKDVVNNFKKVQFNKIIFTKLDEAVTFGSIFNIMSRIPQPLTYVTTGQSVPEDIEEADASKLAKLVLGI